VKAEVIGLVIDFEMHRAGSGHSTWLINGWAAQGMKGWVV